MQKGRVSAQNHEVCSEAWGEPLRVFFQQTTEIIRSPLQPRQGSQARGFHDTLSPASRADPMRKPLWLRVLFIPIVICRPHPSGSRAGWAAERSELSAPPVLPGGFPCASFTSRCPCGPTAPSCSCVMLPKCRQSTNSSRRRCGRRQISQASKLTKENDPSRSFFGLMKTAT